MSSNIPLIGSIATIQAVDLVPSNGFEIAKLVIQGVIALIGYLHHRKLSKQNSK